MLGLEALRASNDVFVLDSDDVDDGAAVSSIVSSDGDNELELLLDLFNASELELREVVGVGAVECLGS